MDFLSNSIQFKQPNYEKQNGSRTSNQLLFRLQNKVRKILLLVMYHLTKFNDVIWSGFELFQKLHLLIYAYQFRIS